MSVSVLVIDDDEDLRETVCAVLEDAGFATASAGDGEQGLAYLRTYPPPDVILLDLSMPIMDGRAFRETQRADPALSTIPVLVFSAAASLDEKVKGLDVSGVIKKPIAIRELVEIVRATASRATTSA